MAEKLQLATEESYRDPANIQSKHQKHQAFEAELAANADRIQVFFFILFFFLLEGCFSFFLVFNIGCACHGSKFD